MLLKPERKLRDNVSIFKVVGFSGHFQAAMDCIEALRNCSTYQDILETPSTYSEKCSVIGVTKDGRAFMLRAEDTWEIEQIYALGSGENWAMAAMDLGYSAKEAVRYAITRDRGTGGKIHTIHTKGKIYGR